MRMLKWLYPGMHVKRWLALAILGGFFISLSLAVLMVQIYREVNFTGIWSPIVYYGTLQFIDRLYRGILLFSLGTAIFMYGVYRLVHSVLSPFVQADSRLVDIIYQKRYLRRGPKIVAVGGGTGLSTLLRGIKEYTGNVTAIVTVADDGGSSGRLRSELGIAPPGDLRNCIAALADAEPLVTQLFQYRFQEGSGLEGHSFGNLFIAAMTAITGDFEKAIKESSRVLAVRGQVFPATQVPLTLCAELTDQAILRGESNVSPKY